MAPGGGSGDPAPDIFKNRKEHPVSITTTAIADIDAPIETAFDYIVPVDLTEVFRGYGMIPAITATSVTDGWNRAGLQRTVTFADGSTSTETLLTVQRPNSFSYKNEELTAPALRMLLKRMEGFWLFTPTKEGGTHIEWTYRLVPTNFLAGLLVRALLLPMVRGMLKNALAIMKQNLER
jgi:hypothetical protein